MNGEAKLLGCYNYTVVLTYIGMVAGFLGIVSAFEGNGAKAVFCLMAAGFCDMFDGAIAATKKDRTAQEKCFGIQIDSLSDLICFGVLPAAIVYSAGKGSKLVLALCAAYVLCALIRLAYFNVDEQQRQNNCTGPRELYLGLPVTLSALVIPAVFAINSLLGTERSTGQTAALLVMGVMFLLPFPLKKPRIAGKICVVLCGFTEFLLVFIACLDM